MDFVLELLSLGLYEWAGMKFFGHPFVDDRRSIPIWRRFLLCAGCWGLLVFIISAFVWIPQHVHF